MDLTAYIASRIHTMNDSMPQATTVVVSDGIIVEGRMLEWSRGHLDLGNGLRRQTVSVTPPIGARVEIPAITSRNDER